MRKAFKKLSVMNALIAAALLLPTSSALADPPPTCSFKVYNCITGCDNFYKLYNVHVFNGNDNSPSIKWAAYEQASLRPGRYTQAKCNHSNCDTDVFNFAGPNASRGSAGGAEDYCGDLYISATCIGDTIFDRTDAAPDRCPNHGSYTRQYP